eukprot:2717074-Rhodomonas_salina.1
MACAVLVSAQPTREQGRGVRAEASGSKGSLCADKLTCRCALLSLSPRASPQLGCQPASSTRPWSLHDGVCT